MLETVRVLNVERRTNNFNKSTVPHIQFNFNILIQGEHKFFS